MEAAEVEYRPFAPFAHWSTGVAEPPDWDLLDRAVDRLRGTNAAAGATSVELSTQRSLLLAALHTGAVEGVHRMNRGVTLTALDGALDWRRVVEDAEGTAARSHVEAALSAYDLAVDAARADALPVTEAWIRRVHEASCAAQDTVVVRTAIGEQAQEFVTGRYKTVPNHVLLADGTMHMYAPPDDVSSEMARLVDELRRPEFDAAHAVLKAAYSHHALTQIHPFQDGNGRVARVVASVPLLKWASVPFHLYEDQVAEYFDALSAADAGAPGDFVAFVYDRVLDIVQLTEDNVAALLPVSELEQARDWGRAVAASRRLQGTIRQLLDQAVDEYDWPEGIDAETWLDLTRADCLDEDGRKPMHDRHSQLTVRLAADERSTRNFPIFAGLDRARPALAIGLPPDPVLELPIDELYPETRTAALARLEAFIRRSVRDTVEALVAGVNEAPRAP